MSVLIGNAVCDEHGRRGVENPETKPGGSFAYSHGIRTRRVGG